MRHLIAVRYCAECPFSYDCEDGGGDTKWTCTQMITKRGWYREIGRVPNLGTAQNKAGIAWRPPPAWCPLRTADFSIKLTVTK